ncbi:hypothetical protein AMS68_004886 [Peltaster fructicola]|uniref:Uncharacterized protein n=1 Tax=Peltaster fructicola TaxID=286661 RepID=A0A6H0XXM1_9PEZI|nr:hypothetical protein AMS68_004886 [Peltaster fructicola]
MKFSAVLAAIAAATVVNAQGYNSTSKATTSAPHTTTQATIYDSRTVNVTRSSTPVTALTSIYTITSSCGSIQIYLPSTKVFALSGADASRSTATYTGTSTGGAVRTGAAVLAGAGGLVAALVL